MSKPCSGALQPGLSLQLHLFLIPLQLLAKALQQEP